MRTVGETFPDFRLKATLSADPKTAFADLSLGDFQGKWKVVFFWPKDFTFVCPTEIIGFDELLRDFKDRDTVLIGGSTDSEYVHLAWRQREEDLRGVGFPWLADIKKELVSALGVLDQRDGVAQRATFIVDPDNVIRFASVNDMSVGRNPGEVLRVLDALQTEELCPCNWHHGEATIGH